MNKIENLFNNFSKIENPKDYFKGMGNLVFPPPDNVLCFCRDNYSEFGLWPYIESHNRYVCIINLYDPLKIVVDQNVQIINSKEGIILLPFQYHKFMIPKKRDKTFCIFITFTMSKNDFFNQFKFNNFYISEKIISSLNQFYTSYYIDKNFERVPFDLGSLLLEISDESNLISRQFSKKIMKDNLLQKIIAQVNINLHLNIIELASFLGYSENYLRRYFKEHMGITLGRFIIELRIAKAIQYLNNDELSISQVAEKCGYDSISSFSRSFKKIVNYSPKNFIKLIKKDPKFYEKFKGQHGLKILKDNSDINYS